MQISYTTTKNAIIGIKWSSDYDANKIILPICFNNFIDDDIYSISTNSIATIIRKYEKEFNEIIISLSDNIIKSLFPSGINMKPQDGANLNGTIDVSRILDLIIKRVFVETNESNITFHDDALFLCQNASDISKILTTKFLRILNKSFKDTGISFVSSEILLENDLQNKNI